MYMYSYTEESSTYTPGVCVIYCTGNNFQEPSVQRLHNNAEDFNPTTVVVFNAF